MKNVRFSLLLILCLYIFSPCQAQRISHTFRNTSLAEALTAVKNEQTAYTITFVNNELEQLTVTTSFKGLTVPETVERLCKGQPVKIKTKKNNIYVQYQKPEKVGTFAVEGYVYDHLTHVELVGATVMLCRTDSTALDTCEARSFWMSGDRSGYSAYYSFSMPRLPREYLLRVSYVGYETTYVPLSLKNLHKREFSRKLPPLYMKRERNMLKEVQVTASKVMFYYRGDTLVYNADAFQLAEGSMLDALIKQLPGVELNKNGQIFHNGKFVQSLLLNGKEFFRGDNRVMLDNLPAYTVKEVKVYDKLSEKAEWLGRNEESDKFYVMDVQLKREYSIGLMSNIETGGGTDNRFLARLFALRFSDHSRIGLYANANNLNDNGTPGENNSWSANANAGRQTLQKAGVDYSVDDRDKRWKVSGNAQVNHVDGRLLTTTDRQDFLSSGDTYEHTASRNRDHNTSLSTSHQLQLSREMVQWSFNPSFNYRHWHNHSANESSALTATDTLLHHNTQQGSQRGHELSANLSATSTIKLSTHTTDNLTLKVSTSLSDKDDDRLNRQTVQYAIASREPSSLLDQHFKYHPDRSRKASASATYAYSIKQGMSLETTYAYSHADSKKERALYVLEQQDSLVLPSISDAERILDFANSYNSHLTEDAHDLSPILWWFPNIAGGRASISLRLPFTLLSQRLHYQRGASFAKRDLSERPGDWSVDTLVTRRTLLFHPDWGYAEWWRKDRKYGVWFAPRISATPPALTNFVDIRDTSDPLNIHLGNSRLKDTYRYNLHIAVRKQQRDKQIYQSLDFKYQYTQNALAMSMLYDEQTGVRTYKPYNVNGNWTTQVGYGLKAPLDKPRRLMLAFIPELTYTKSVDLAGTHGLLERSKVGTTKMEQFIELKYKLGKHLLTLSSENTWQHVNIYSRQKQQPSANQQNNSFSVADYKTSLSAQLKLPWKIELTTDLNLYNRRGYSDTALNTSEWVWNGRISRSFLNGQLLMMLDGFDLLGQLSNISRAINAQGRTETWTNTQPRYVLLHAVWRWNHSPRKK